MEFVKFMIDAIDEEKEDRFIKLNVEEVLYLLYSPKKAWHGVGKNCLVYFDELKKIVRTKLLI
jgi:hypothetical protein